jgi:hypothetical protein
MNAVAHDIEDEIDLVSLQAFTQLTARQKIALIQANIELF